MADFIKLKQRGIKGKTIFYFKKILWNKIVLVIFLYSFLVIIFTYPLILHLTTHISGDGNDGPTFVWNAWWFSKALSSGENILYTNYILYPEGADLLFHTHTYVHDMLIFIIKPLFGLIASFNIVFLMSIVFGALGMYFLSYDICRNRVAAFLGGFVFAFAPCVIVRTLGHFNLVAVWPIPWFFYFLVRMFRTLKLRYGIFSGVFFGLAIYNDIQYSLFIILLTFIFLFVYFISSPKRFFNKKLIIGFLLMAAAIILVSFPLLFNYVKAGINNNLPVKPPIEDYEIYSADLMRFITPSFLNPFLGKLAYIKTNFSEYGGGIENTVFVGYLLIILSFIALIFVRGKLRQQYGSDYIFDHPFFWLLIIFIGIILSLGPTLTIFGQKVFNIFNNNLSIPLPYRWLWHLPIIGGLRVPSRFMVVAMLGLAILASISFGWLLLKIGNFKKKKIFKLLLTAVIFILIFFEYLPIPIKINDLRLPSVYQQLDREQTKTILDIPTGVRSGFRRIGNPISLYQFAQSVHEHPVVGGFVARLPNYVFDNLEGKPGLSFLLNFPSVKEGPNDFSPKLVREAMTEKEINTIIVHKDKINNNAFLQILRNYIEKVVGGQYVSGDSDYDLFIISKTTPDNLSENIKEEILPTLATLSIGETVENNLLPKRFTQSIIKTTGADICLINLDAFKDGIPEGKIDLLDIVRVYPWDDNICEAEIKKDDFEKIMTSNKLAWSKNIAEGQDESMLKAAFPCYLISGTSYFGDISLDNIKQLSGKVIESVVNSVENSEI